MKPLKHVFVTLVCASALMMPERITALADTGQNIISSIDSRMATLDTLIFAREVPAPAPMALAAHVAVTPDTLYANAVDILTDARISTIKAQTGVQLTGQTYYRADNALGLDEDDDAVSRYIGKIQVEARWYFLQSGLLKRGSRIAEQKLKGDIEVLEHEKERSNPSLYARRERMLEISDSVLASIMLHRVDNLKLLEQAYQYLLSTESISGDDLLRILDDRAEAERRLSTISVAATPAPALAGLTAGTVSIDTAAVVAALADTDIDLRLLGLRSALMERQAKNETWWSDVRLAPFVRYSYYFRRSLAPSNNLDAGVSFTIPINAEASRRRAALRAEKDLLESRADDIVAKGAEKVHYIAVETERLNRAITGEWSRATSLKEYLHTRRQAYSRRAGEYNRIAALKEYNSYLRCLENIVDLQYRRDCLLADLQALVPAVPVLSFCTFTPLTH